MQYDVETPEAYLTQLEDDWRREKVLELRGLIFSSASSIEECIHYKMLGYKLADDFVFHLNAQKNYVSLYAGDADRIDPKGELLVGLSVGKGCIRFSKSKAVSDSRIAEFIESAITLKNSGVKLEC